MQKVERYSVQRHFSEIWDFRECKSLTDERNRALVEVLPEAPQILDRKAPYALYEDIELLKAKLIGCIVYDGRI